MTSFDKLFALAGTYDDVDAAKADWKEVRKFHGAARIGKFQAAIFTKRAEDDIHVIDTTSTTRTTGAKWGTLAGAVALVLFPPAAVTELVGAAAIGALTGNVLKGWGPADVRRLGECVDVGQSGILLIAEANEALDPKEFFPAALQTTSAEFVRDENLVWEPVDEE